MENLRRKKMKPKEHKRSQKAEIEGRVRHFNFDSEQRTGSYW